jgi:hypothetical protein
MRVRVTPFPDIGEVEAAGASADDGDAHVFLPIDSILTNLGWRLIRAGNLRYRKMIGERGLTGPGTGTSRARTGGHGLFQPAGSVRERLSALRQPA